MTEKKEAKAKGKGSTKAKKEKADVIPFPNVVESDIGLKTGKEEWTPENYKALVNHDTQHVYNLVTTDYLLHKHEDVVEMLLGIIKDNPQFGKPDLKVAFNGEENARMRATATFREVDFLVGANDRLHPNIEVYNSYDGTWALRGSFGTFRVICSNGMTIGEKFAQYRREHHQHPDREEFAHVIKVGMENYSDRVDLWNTWLDHEVKEAEYRRVMKGMNFNKTETEGIGDMAEAESGLILGNHKMYRDVVREEADKAGTEAPVFAGVDVTDVINKWLLFNIVTQYLTHHVDSMMKKSRMEGRLSRLMAA